MGRAAVSQLVDTENEADEAGLVPKQRRTPTPRGDGHELALPRLVGYDVLTSRTGVSADVFRRARQRGELTPWGTPGRVLFDEAEVAAWLLQPRRRRTARVYAAGPAGLPGSRVHF